MPGPRPGLSQSLLLITQYPVKAWPSPPPEDLGVLAGVKSPANTPNPEFVKTVGPRREQDQAGMRGYPEGWPRKALSRMALYFWTPIRIKARWQRQADGGINPVMFEALQTGQCILTDRDFSFQLIIK